MDNYAILQQRSIEITYHAFCGQKQEIVDGRDSEAHAVWVKYWGVTRTMDMAASDSYKEEHGGLGPPQDWTVSVDISRALCEKCKFA